MDLRWAHQSLVAEIIAMVAVIVAILSEYMVTECDTKTGQLALIKEGSTVKNEVYPVLTSDFSCAQTVSLLVSDFIVLAVMIIALVFSTSIWHHKFHAMKNIMKVTLHTTRTRKMMRTAPKLSKEGGGKKVSKWTALKQKTNAAQALGVLKAKFTEAKPSYPKRESSMALRLTNLHKREEHIKSVLRLKSWHSMGHVIETAEEVEAANYETNPLSSGSDLSSRSSQGGSGLGNGASPRKRFTSQSTVAQAHRIAVKATERFNKRVGGVNTGKMGLWNLREAINLHYRRHFLLLLFSVGYSVCYSMVVVAEIRDELKDLRQRVSINPGNLDCQVPP
jgi:hypothetical protein